MSSLARGDRQDGVGPNSGSGYEFKENARFGPDLKQFGGFCFNGLRSEHRTFLKKQNDLLRDAARSQDGYLSAYV
jgi:hypothetical protein